MMRGFEIVCEQQVVGFFFFSLLRWVGKVSTSERRRWAEADECV